MGDENDIKYLNCNPLKNLRVFKDSPKASLDEFNQLTSHKSKTRAVSQSVSALHVKAILFNSDCF